MLAKAKEAGADFAIVGFRDESFVRHLRPRLTRFEVSLHEVGASLASALLGQINSSDSTSPQLAQVKVPMTLLPGDSDRPSSNASNTRDKPTLKRAPTLQRVAGRKQDVR